MRYLLIAAIALSLGCSAEFTDLRPEEVETGNNTTADNNQTTDPNNASTSPDAGGNNASVDADAADGASSNNTDPGEETLIATGDFVNVDYQTVGSAQYWQLSDGSYEVRLTMDFSTQGVPGPAIALSPRNPLGGAIAGDEVDLGALDMNSGAQAYAFSGEPSDYGFVWIWCKPFGLDVAYAEMEFQ